MSYAAMKVQNSFLSQRQNPVSPCFSIKFMKHKCTHAQKAPVSLCKQVTFSLFVCLLFASKTSAQHPVLFETFTNICDLLGFDPEYIRKLLLKREAKFAKPARSKLLSFSAVSE